jgi:hypothetical protein
MSLLKKPLIGYLVLAWYLVYLVLVGALYLVNRAHGVTPGGSLLAIGIVLMAIPALPWIAYYRVVLPLAWLARMCVGWMRHQRRTWTLVITALVAIWLFGAALAFWFGDLLVGLLALGAGLGLVSIAYECRVGLIASLTERLRKRPQDRGRTVL